jgi:hypothetical protein
MPIQTEPRSFAPKSNPAVVCRAPGFRETQDQYLRLAEDGTPRWVSDPAAATAFDSMREAARMALRLPAAIKAFGLPRIPEIAVHGGLH